jgi:tetratricopeptide (TPR) repeat protein
MKLFQLRLLTLLFVLTAHAATAEVSGDPKAASGPTVLITEANSAQNVGDYVASEQARRRAILMMIAAEAPPVEMARQLSNLASVLNINGKPVEAEKLCREAEALLTYYPTEDHVQLAALRGNLAEALRRQHQLDEARKKFEDALKILSTISLGDSHFAASNIIGLGAIEAELGNSDEAVAYYERALPVLIAIGGKDHPLIQRYVSEYKTLLAITGAD